MEKAVKLYFSIFFLLVVFGMVMVFNIRMFNVPSAETAFVPQIRALVVNFVFAGAGFMVAYFLNLSWLKNSSKYLIPFIFLLILATLVIGTKVNGSRRWINLHFMMIQPSEFAKIIVVIYLSEVMTKKGAKIRLVKDLLYPLGLVFAVSFFIAVEDLGTATVIFATSIVLLLLGGMDKKHLMPLIPLALIGFCVMVFMPGKSYRVSRFASFIEPCAEQHRTTFGYQQCEARIALGVGGVSGVGFGNSTRKIRHLPESHTDFIFPVIGEEFGFIGSLVMILLFMTMFAIGTYFVLHIHDTFNFYMVAGFVLMLAGQAVFNLLVITSLSPNKGVPLPFISYGGSALLTYSVMVGLILNAVTSESRR